MTKVFFLKALFLAIFCSCGQSNSINKKDVPNSKTSSNNDTSSKTQFYLDTSIIVILPFDQPHPWLFKDAKPATLTSEELGKIEQLLIDCINTHNAKQDTTKQFSEFIDLKKYKRQYIPFINSKGERNVYVNCFCTSDWGSDYWKKNLCRLMTVEAVFFK